MAESLQSVFRSLLDLFLERRCPVCGNPLGRHEQDLCLTCEADLPLTGYWRMPRNPMADRFNARLSESRAEGDSVAAERAPAAAWSAPGAAETLPTFRYVRAAALFFYRTDAGYDAIPKALKYRARFRLGRHYAAQLGQALHESPLFRDVDAVIPVPLHPVRRLRRGYNQAEVLAKEVARQLGAALRTDLLKRRRYTRTQTHIRGSEEKSGNVAGAFSLRPKALRSPAGQIRHVLLLDDVFTTGSTLEACFRTLLPLFPPEQVRISIATLAVVKE